MASLTWLLLSSLVAASHSAAQDVVRFAAFFPFSNQEHTDYFLNGDMRQCAAGAILAAKHFNTRDGAVVSQFADVPSDCPTVELFIRDTWASPTRTFQLYMDLFEEGDMTVDAIVGPARSACCAPLATTATLENLPTVSYWATSPSLEQETLYPFFGRTIPADDAIAEAAVVFFQEQGWTRVGVLFVNDAYGQGYAAAIGKACSDRALNCKPAAHENLNADSIASALDTIRNFRIFVAISYGDDIATIVDTARSKGMTGATTWWLFTDAVSLTSMKALNAEQAAAISGAGRILAAGAVPGERGHESFSSLYTLESSDEYNSEYMEAAHSRFALLDDDFFDKGLNYEVANFAYDALAALALAACKRHTQQGSVASSGDALFTAFKNISFQGASGLVRFGATGSRKVESANFIMQNFLFDSDARAFVDITVAKRWQGDMWVAGDEPFIFSTGTQHPPSSLKELDCGPGSVQEQDECVKCEPGSFKSSNTSCSLCSGYSFAESAGSDVCEPCGLRSHILDFRLGSSSRYDCVCEQGSYAREYPLRNCKSCDGLHAVCLGGDCQPYPKKNYWMHPSLEYKAVTYRCRSGFFCRGGKRPIASARFPAEDNVFFLNNSQLSRNKSGKDVCLDPRGESVTLSNRPQHWCKFGRDVATPLCDGTTSGTSDPSRRYFVISKLSVRWCAAFHLLHNNCMCRSPTQSRVGRILFTVACWLVLLTLFGLINEVIRPQYQVMDLVLDVFQDIGIISTFQLFDVDTYGPTCLFPEWGYAHTFWLMLSLPFAYAALVGLRVLLLFGFTPPAAVTHRAIGSAINFLFCAFPSLVIQVESVYTCQRFAGLGLRQVEFNAQRCGSSSHRVRMWFATFYGLFFLIALPAAIALHVSYLWRQNRLCSQSTLDVYGSLYRSFHADALHWSLFRVIKQAALATISITLYSSPLGQGLAAIALLVILLKHQVHMKPHITCVANFFELYGLLLSMMTVLLGLLFTFVNTLDEIIVMTKQRKGNETLAFIIIFYVLQGTYLLHGVVVSIIEACDVHARTQIKRVVGDEAEEILDSFKGRSLQSLFRANAAVSVRHSESAIHAVCPTDRVLAVDKVIKPYVADVSITNNFSCCAEARFYRNVDSSFPALLDTLIDCSEEKRCLISRALRLVAKESAIRSAAGCNRSKVLESIDRSSVLFFLLHSPNKHRVLFRDLARHIVAADPVLAADYERLCRLRLALLLQRSFRNKNFQYIVRLQIEAKSKSCDAPNSVSGSHRSWPSWTSFQLWYDSGEDERKWPGINGNRLSSDRAFADQHV